jgi:O-antigen/teichoic acid export membrane protein
LENSLYYFIPKLGLDRRRTLLSQTTMLNLMVASLVGGVMFFGAHPIAVSMKNMELVPLLQILALYPLPHAINATIPAFMISVDRTLRAAIYSLILSAGRVIVTAILFAWGYDLAVVMWGSVIFTGAVALVGWLDMFRFAGTGLPKWDRRLILDQLHYCWPMWITAVIGAIMFQYDKLLISWFFTTERFAVYSRGAMELPIIGLVTSSVATAIMPNLVVLADQGRIRDALNLWKEAARKCSLLIFPCFVFFMVIARDLFLLMYPADFADAAWPFMIYLLIMPVRIVIFGNLFRALGKTRPYAISAVAGLLADVTIGSLVTWLGRGTWVGFIGPSLGMLAAVLGTAIYCFIKLRSILDMPVGELLRWKELGGTMLISIFCGVFVWLLPLPPLPLLMTLSIQAVVFAAAMIFATVYLRMLKPDEVELAMAPVRIVRRFLKRLPFGQGETIE